MSRPLHEIASEILREWKPVNYAARPYLDAMLQLQTINDRFGYDDAEMIVLYFLSNAKTWRGPAAQRIKAELKTMLARKNPRKSSGEKIPEMWLLSAVKQRERQGMSPKEALEDAVQAWMLQKQMEEEFEKQRRPRRNPYPYFQRSQAICYLCGRQVPVERVRVQGKEYDVCRHCRTGMERGVHTSPDEEAEPIQKEFEFAAVDNPLVNPPAKLTKIYNRVIEIKASKAGMPHECDDKCRAAGHRYVHRVSSKACIWGLPDGRLLIGE